MRNIVYRGHNFIVSEAAFLEYKVVSVRTGINFTFKYNSRHNIFKAYDFESKIWVDVGRTFYDAINCSCDNILKTITMQTQIRNYLDDPSIRHYRGI